MNLKRLNAHHYVCDQLTPEHVSVLHERGIRSIINNRPDGEAEDQPASDALEDAATALGMEYLYVPISTQQLTSEEVEANEQAILAMSKPLCGFCRTGTRAVNAWALVEAKHEYVCRILDVIDGAGYPTESIGVQICEQQSKEGANA